MPSSPDGPKDGRILPVVANPHNPHKKHRSKAGLWLDSWWVLDPRTAKFITWWDLLMTLALFYVALVTPVEVAFIDAPDPAEKWTDSIFLINRMLDCLFITDMVLQFRLGFKSETAEGTQWIMSSHAIAMNYLKSFWFSLDFFSVLTSVFDLVDIGGANSLVSLKVLRTLRLLKLVKLARGSRVFKRQEMRMSIDYSMLSVTSILVVITLTCHWTACLWGMSASLQTDKLASWAGREGYCLSWEPDADGHYPPCPDQHSCKPAHGALRHGTACRDGFSMYVYCLYFSIMTITSVGFGHNGFKMEEGSDPEAARTAALIEQILCSLIMFVTALIWGYLVGVFCTVSAPSPEVQAFRDELSQLNAYMIDHNLPKDLRFRLREFLHETVHLRDAMARKRLLSKLSPAMQGEVALLVNRGWVSKVWYLQKDTQLELTIDLAANLKAQVFAPREFCPCGVMYICHKGSALYGGRTRYPGSSWGEDVLIRCSEDISERSTLHPLELSFSAIAITYLWVYSIDAGRLHASLEKFPRAQRRLFRVARMWVLRRAVVRHAERLCYERGETFRGRSYPIYAKELTARVREERAKDHNRKSSGAGLFDKPHLVRRSTCTSSFPQPQKDGTSAASQAEQGASSSSFMRRLPFTRRSSPQVAPVCEESVIRRRINGGRRFTVPLQVGPSASAAMDENEMRAAINFGLQLREEQQKTQKTGSTLSDAGAAADTTRSLLEEIRQMKANKARLWDEVRQMKADMHEMLTLVLGESPVRRRGGTGRLSPTTEALVAMESRSPAPRPPGGKSRPKDQRASFRRLPGGGVEMAPEEPDSP